MALTVYRYRRDAPFTNAQLVKLAGSGAVNVAAAGGPIYDVQIDDTKLADLDDAMGQAGYTRIATAPVGTPPSQIRDAAGTILTLGTVADGQGLQRSGTNLIGAAPPKFDMRDVLLFEHFLTNNTSSAQATVGTNGFIVSATGTGNNQLITAEAGYPGILRLVGGTAALARSAAHVGDTTFRNLFQGGTNPINFECLVSFRVGVASTNFLRCQMGMGSGWALANPNPLTDGIYFRLEPGTSGNIFGVCAAASVRTVQDLGVAAVAGTWYRLGWTWSNPGIPQVQFRLNGVDVGSPVTTNIPSELTGLGFRADSGGLTASDLFVDYALLTQVTNKET